MTRDDTLYSSMRGGGKAFGFDPSTPVPGFYRMRLGAGQLRIGIRLWYGPPHDPVTGEELDRSWRFQAQADDGEFLDMERVWPACAKDRISEADFIARQGRTAWAQQAAPESAYADRRHKYDPLRARDRGRRQRDTHP